MMCVAESVQRQSLASLVPLSDQPGQPLIEQSLPCKQIRMRGWGRFKTSTLPV